MDSNQYKQGRARTSRAGKEKKIRSKAHLQTGIGIHGASDTSNGLSLLAFFSFPFGPTWFLLIVVQSNYGILVSGRKKVQSCLQEWQATAEWNEVQCYDRSWAPEGFGRRANSDFPGEYTYTTNSKLFTRPLCARVMNWVTSLLLMYNKFLATVPACQWPTLHTLKPCRIWPFSQPTGH